ncbi:MAG TPA: polyprenyl synthetase family protein [Deltaproteobacteria bacterium]|nr:polyprenyl synthetase family protein [Deltaproteobacteria bacterium]
MNAAFEENLKKLLDSSTSFTSEIGRYILDSGGKRLRPRIVKLVGTAIGLSDEDILPLAYTVELMHTASLLHDDVVDGTEIRRSRPTANQVYGDKPALLAGDFISASAFEIVLRQGNLSVALSMIQTIKKMAEGELKELEYAKSFHDNLEIYLDIIYLKTASLFEFCSSAPGHLAGLSPDEIELLGLYGRNIGMGFQIVDDIINLTPNEEDTKDAYNDIAEGKSTLPLVILFRENPEVLSGVQAVKDLLQKQQYLIGHISQDILLRSRDIARNYLVNANERLTGTRFLTGEVSRISSSILSQLEERV